MVGELNGFDQVPRRLTLSRSAPEQKGKPGHQLMPFRKARGAIGDGQRCFRSEFLAIRKDGPLPGAEAVVDVRCDRSIAPAPLDQESLAGPTNVTYVLVKLATTAVASFGSD
jgi:hypothetical protein